MKLLAPIEPGMMPSSPLPDTDRALARDEHVFVEVALLRDVVVLAGDMAEAARHVKCRRARNLDNT
jgi:hypothetical protein